MDIAFVSNVVYPFVTGGAEKRIHEIGTRLVDRGHKVTIYGRNYWAGPQAKSYKGMLLRAVAPRAELYRDNGRRSIREALGFASRLVRPLRRHVRSHDIVVVSVFPYFPVVSCKLAVMTTATPLVTTWHEVWKEYWSEYLGRLSPLGMTVERATAKIPQYPIAVSETTADRLASIGPSREDIAVVPNGIDSTRIQNVPPAEEGFDVLFAGRLIEDKNVDVLIRAFDSVAESRNVTLGIIGNGPQRYTLERVANTSEASERISFLGFLDDYEDVLAQMKAATVFASPSTREGFGITYLEAMAANCCVIGVDHPESSAAEVIEQAGFLTEPSANAIATVLERALDGDRPDRDPTERAKQYDWDCVAKQAEKTYSRAIRKAW